MPGLAVVIVGVRKDSQSYVSMKRKSCAEVGIRSIDVDFPEQISGVDVVAKVHELNDDPDVHGSSSRSSLFSTLLVISDDQELVPWKHDGNAVNYFLIFELVRHFSYFHVWKVILVLLPFVIVANC